MTSMIAVSGLLSCSAPSVSSRQADSWSDSQVTEFCRDFLQLATESAQEIAPNLSLTSPDSGPGVIEATYHEGRQFGEFKVAVEPPEKSGDATVKFVFEIEEKTLLE